MHLSHYAPGLGEPCANYQDNLRCLYLINKPSNRIINHILWPANQNFIPLYKKIPRILLEPLGPGAAWRSMAPCTITGYLHLHVHPFFKFRR